MKRISITIMLMAVFGSSAFAESTNPSNRTCDEKDCSDLYRRIAADAIMALPGSAEASMVAGQDWWGSYNFKQGIAYSLCIKMNRPENDPISLTVRPIEVRRAAGVEECRSKYGVEVRDGAQEVAANYAERWQKGKDAADKVWSLFESAGVVINYSVSPYMGHVMSIYRKSKVLEQRINPLDKEKVAAAEELKSRQFNDNSSLSLEENIRITIASAKKMKEEWDSKEEARNAPYKAAEAAQEANFRRIEMEARNEANENVYAEIKAATKSKTPKGRLKAARQVMCKSIENAYDSALPYTNPGGNSGREYKLNASRDAFFSMLESSGGNKYHRFEDSPTTYKRYCK